MRTQASVTIAAPPSAVFPQIEALDRYPAWLPLVHEATPEPDAEPAAWSVELRARVGLFARSKRLRMVRVASVADTRVEFERGETDGRDHARWALTAELAPTDDGTLVTMHLAYDGDLWGGAILERVLSDQIRKGQAGLAAAVERPA